jgi:hypothetical protein
MPKNTWIMSDWIQDFLLKSLDIFLCRISFGDICSFFVFVNKTVLATYGYSSYQTYLFYGYSSQNIQLWLFSLPIQN